MTRVKLKGLQREILVVLFVKVKVGLWLLVGFDYDP